MNDTVNPFELQVGGPNGIDNADVPVRWCITPEFITKMEQDGIEDPHIVLVSVDPNPGRGEMSRHLVPVGELMTYVRFTRAGDMKIYGWIVDGSCGRRALHSDFLGRARGKWNTQLVNGWAGTPEENIEGAYVGTRRDVHIPTDVFGKEPPRWLKWYANLWHSKPANDQCEFRKRVAIGIPKIVPVAVVGLLLTTIKVFMGSVVALAGWRHSVQWRYAWRPFKYPVAMIWNGLDVVTLNHTDHQDNPQKALFFGDSSWWLGQRFLWWRKLRTGDNIIGLFFLPFTPLLLLVILSACYATTGYFTDAVILTAQWLAVMLFMTGIVDLVIHTLITLVEYYEEISESIIGVPMRWITRRWRSLDGYLAQNDLWPRTIAIVSVAGGLSLSTFVIVYWTVMQWVVYLVAIIGGGYFVGYQLGEYLDRRAIDMNDPTRMRELLCPDDRTNLVASYNAIPLDRRTLGLKFKTIKNHICRPMQM